MLASHLPSRAGVSQSARSWVPKRVRNARLTGESISANRPTAPGKHVAQVRAQLVGGATRWATRSLRARQVRRSVTVWRAVRGQGRSRARSVRSVSARTNASNRSSLLPADP